MKTKIIHFISSLLIKISKNIVLNAIRAMIISASYCIYLLSLMLDVVMQGLTYVGHLMNINITFLVSEDIDMTKKFSDDEIYNMSKQVKEGSTIKDIQNQFPISYRQARKIADIAKSNIHINMYQTA